MTFHYTNEGRYIRTRMLPFFRANMRSPRCLRPSDASDAADPGLGAAGREARLALLVVVADDELDCARRFISKRINEMT
jgi:hypothetical protein